MLKGIHAVGLLAAVAAAVSTGCATPSNTPAAEPSAAQVVAPPLAPAPGSELTLGGAIADLAMGMVGARYHYGGTDPVQGFDCSGLAFYAYEQAGYRIPRTSQEQFRASRKIKL